MKDFDDFDLTIFYSFTEKQPYYKKCDKNFNDKPNSFLIYSKDLTG